MLSAVIFWAVIASIVSAAFFGLLRGLPRAFLRFFTVLVSFIASFFLCKTLSGDPERLLGTPIVARLFSELPLLGDLTEAVPELESLAVSLPAAMLAPLVFFLLFLVISELLLLVYGIAAAFIFPKNGGKDAFSPLSHILGMAVGALQGLLVALAMMLPIVGLTDVAIASIDTVAAEGGEYRVEALEQLSDYRHELVEVREGELYRFAERFGGGSICAALMQYESEDGEESVDIREQTLALVRIYAHSFPLQGVAPSEFGARQAAALRSISQDLRDSEVLGRVLAELLSGACREWKQGEAFLGLEPIRMQGKLSSLPAALYGALEGSSPETVCEDLESLADLVDILARHGVLVALSDGQELLCRITAPEALSEITLCLDQNPRFAAVADRLARIALSVFRDAYLSEPSETDPGYGAYREMLGRVAEALNDISFDLPIPEQTEVLIVDLRQALLDFGIEDKRLSDPLLKAAAEHLLCELSGDGITADDVGRVLSSIGS